ncbi:MAG: MarR family winged helix-turn-helix transcriptional regulator [Gammaproteobacteria bacterium]
MKPGSLDLEDFLPYRLSVLSNMISSSIAGAYSEYFGLSINEWRVMAVLGRFPGLSAAEVAERTAMDKVAVSRAVARLIDSGRARRETAAEDRRRSVLELTAEGRRIYDRLTPVLLRYEAELLDALGPSQRRRLMGLLTDLQEAARRLGPPRLD